MADVENATATDLTGILSILNDMQEAFRTFGDRLERMEARAEQVEARIGRLETRAMASETNAIARGLNGAIIHPDLPLHALRAPATNTMIPIFPATSADIGNMDSPTIDQVLAALCQPAIGSLAEKRKRLKHTIGVVLEVL
ncbi:hypothetical protein RB594_002576 [Gaeumannomyces avenae]